MCKDHECASGPALTHLAPQPKCPRASTPPHPQTNDSQVVSALDQASRVGKPDLSCLFTDVYADMPWNLSEQLTATLDFARKHPEVVPPDVHVR